MFAHLHCHFFGSYSDSLLDPDRDLSYIKEMGQEAVAITDHGVLDYCYPFYWSCRRVGLHPVLGCEVYFVDDARKSIETNDSYRNHLILLARDNEGFRNLVRLNNRSWLENNFGETRGLVDWKLLEEFHDGLIALSGCFWGSLPQKYITGGMEAAEKEFRRYYDIFGRDFYPELGRHGITDEEKANEGLIALSKRFGVTPVVTNDSHYRLARDWRFHDILIKTRFGYPTDFELGVRNYYLKSEEEMRVLGFPPEYYDITMEIARQCRVDLDGIQMVKSSEAFRPEDGAVFSSRPVIIDVRQALRDVTGVWKIKDDRLPEIISLIPPTLDPAEAAREVPALGEWLEGRPRVREAIGKLVGIPRRSLPDFSAVIDLPLHLIREFLPVRRARGEIMASPPGWALRKLSVPLVPVVSLAESAPDFCAWVKKLTTLEEAREKFEERKYASAALILEGLLRVNSDDLEARFLLAESLYFLHRYEKAVEEYGVLEEENYNPWRMPRLLTRKGWACNRLGRPDQARRSFRKAIELKENYGPARYALGILDYREGNSKAAKENLRAFIELRPEGERADKARAILRRLDPGL
ncbi:MAG: PHP domain-containing protein [Candidatus Euphemobacter frigidus]|nr:PHP domain-containing protein [Candidatus Euphemobacter frigidus]MDP8276289.1 PHP domain-containing protein [Candidatus Euphemobacter frigidus]